MSRPRFVHQCAQRCITESRFPAPPPAAPRTGIQPEIVVDLQRGKVPLWAQGTTLNWRFDPKAVARHGNPDAMKRKVRKLLREAIEAWGETPVAFRESDEDWDFEIAVLKRKDCDDEGCTLASAFFPEPVRQRVLVYPSMFDYDHAEQVSTMVHELGHVFGLRHYFADTDSEEKKFPSLVYGKHSGFTVMNYGPRSHLTEADRKDLLRLYQAAWSAEPEQEIGKQVRLVQAPHAARL
jgi:hypothetical protein